MTYVTVLHYERIALTADCCRTLVSQNEPVRVVVVDNASPSHDEATLRSALPAGVETLRLAENRGFGAGMNAGMRLALADQRTDSVLFLNNDTRCPPELVGAMRAVLSANPRVGIVGCDMEGAGGGDSMPAAAKLGRTFAYPRKCRAGEAPDYLQGACLLLPRDVLETIGGFDEDYRFFFEDADLSLRVKQLGRLLAVVPGVRIFHYGSATLGALGERQAEWFREGHRTFLRKWRTHPRLRALPPFLAGLACQTLHGRFAAARGTLRGYFKPITR